MYSKTKAAIVDYDNNREFERMCGAILIALGYREIVLVAPQGGNDGGQDVLFTTESGGKGLACVTLRKDITKKFKEDFLKRSPGEFEKYYLFCSTYVTALQKRKFINFCLENLQASFVLCDCESLTILLDSLDKMRQIRDKYLYGIPDDIAPDDQRDSILLSYFDRISQLLKEGLRESNPNHTTRSVAQLLTLTTLPRLDSKRKTSVLQFLYESRLIEKVKPIVGLDGADFRQVNLNGADFRQVNLNGADLSEARLTGAFLVEAHLLGTNLNQAYLNGADLRNANLSSVYLNRAMLIGANLSGADLTDAELSGANLAKANLSGAYCARVILIGANLSETKLTGANLSDGADISNADLRKADLSEASLKYANFTKADLSETNLSEADLSGAFLTEAIVTMEQLDKAKYLNGATMPNGLINPW